MGTVQQSRVIPSRKERRADAAMGPNKNLDMKP